MKKENLPLVSFVTPMKEKDFRVLKLIKSIREQNYPQNKIEIIITDGGSNPEVIQACKKLGAKIFSNPKQLAEGAGMGKDQGIWKSKGKYIVIAESDIELIGKEWIRRMIAPLEEDSSLFASIPKLYVNPTDNLTNRYLSYVGVDPFAVNRSIEGQMELNREIKKQYKKGYFVLSMDKSKPYCMGSNGFMFRKELIKKVGDYAQDVEFIARLSKAGYLKFAFVPDSKVWHKNVKGFWDFIKKRIKWTRNYSTVYIHEKKDFNWITSKPQFVLYVTGNLILAPALTASIIRLIKYRDSAWLLHTPLTFISTALNIFFTFTSSKMLKQVISAKS